MKYNSIGEKLQQSPDYDLNYNVWLLAESQSVAHIGIWQWKLAEEVQWSQELFKIYGLSPNSCSPTFESYLERVHPDDRARVRKTIANSIENKLSFVQEERIVRPDGQVRHLHTWGHPVLDKKGNLERFIGVCQDDTERKEVEKKLLTSEEKFRNMVQSSQDGIWQVNDTGEIIFVNERMAEILDYPSKEMLGRNIFSFVDESKRDLAAQFLESSRNSRTHSQFPLRKKDGSRIWTVLAGNPLFDDSHQSMGAMAVVTDETKLIHNEILLSSLRDIFDLLNNNGTIHQALTILILSIERIIEGVIGSVLLLDDQGQHVLSGAAPNLPDDYNAIVHGQPIGPRAGSCGTAAYTRRTVIVEDIQTNPLWTDYKDIAKKYGLYACWSTPIINEDGLVLGTFAMYFKEIRRPTVAEMALVQDAAGVAKLVINHVRMRATEVTVAQKKEAIVARERQLKSELQEMIKNREDFILLASHELRTPLTPLTLQLELARLALSDPNKSEKDKSNELYGLILGAEQQVAKLAKLSEDLLNVTWINADRIVLHKSRCKLLALVEKSLEKMSEDFASSNCTRKMKVIADSEGMWDAEQIDRVIYHMVSNAIKFGAGQPIEIQIDRDDHYGIVRIRDHGIGISKRDQKRLFKRFERIASLRNYAGLGIGLYVSKEIVLAHGGRIEVESEIGHGACFSAYLPNFTRDEVGASTHSSLI